MKIESVLFRTLPGLFLVLLVMVMSGCSSFHKDWKQTAQAAGPTNDITGAWEGKWVSERNGHTGRLLALIDKQSNTVYRARFHATFWKVFSYKYTVPLQVFEEPDGFHFDGSSHLGWWAGGEYKCHGMSTPTSFRAVYSSKADRGTFDMGRPTRPANP